MTRGWWTWPRLFVIRRLGWVHKGGAAQQRACGVGEIAGRQFMKGPWRVQRRICDLRFAIVAPNDDRALGFKLKDQIKSFEESGC
ncbi:hypothetical protein L484_007229 [Morus notabilis]|uniref:Uncharacterized protein n=1 Tax=Morus notabilis TaxID=981085 RepID=W9QU33_9ROSA|nr:hypothetical protein L484_007229 [Morus notabilis]